MEMKRKKQRTISAVFLKYTCVLAGGALFWLALLVLIFVVLFSSGVILPANYAELQLNENAEEFREASRITEDMIPIDCTYGVYRGDGSWMYGTFPKEEQGTAWEHYREANIYGYGNRLYRFFYRDAGEVCIVNYELTVQFRNVFLRKHLPGIEGVLIILYVFLFLMHTAVVSRSFGKYMKKKLSVLNEATEEIRNQNLEFEPKHSEIQEVEEVLDSLYQMKETLRKSLYRQWDLEKSREEQIAALAHDIKTPLTTIRGNAELLAEGELGREEQEYNQYILQSVEILEGYLAMLNEVVLAKEETEKERDSRTSMMENLSEEKSVTCEGNGEDRIACETLADRMEQQARLLASTRQCTVLFGRTELSGEIRCNESQMTRAFQNIVSNALDYTSPGKGIRIQFSIREVQEVDYLVVEVLDEGPGFSTEDLKHAAERFYQGDKSRSSKGHYGIGLHTASEFAQAQGGYVKIENREDGGGKVTLFIRVEDEDGTESVF